MTYLKFKVNCFIIIGVLSFSLVFTSCSKDTKTAKKLSITEIRKLEKILPKDSILKEKYKRSCIVCHTNPEALAPLVKDNDAWEPILATKNLDELVQNVVKGIKTMPPKGQCGDCTEEELKSLIKFLANIE